MRDTISQRLSYYKALIPAFYPEEFPSGFVLRPQDWVLDPERVSRQVVLGNGDQIRALATLDVEILSSSIVQSARNRTVNLVKNYPCGLRCPGCFSEEDIFADSERLMFWREVMQVIDVAREIGLQSIKFLGPGELFQNPELFEILDACKSRNLPISIFTKGAELGDDELARRNYGFLGITTAAALVEQVASYSNVRILLGFNSFFPHRQDALVGSTSVSTHYQIKNGVFLNRGIADYTTKRDAALLNLCRVGFNDPAFGQRLTLVMAPLQRNQLDEIEFMYEWAARRNIPLIIAPSMESGPKALDLVTTNRRADPEQGWIKQAYLKIYRTALRVGIHSLEQLKRKGVSAYIGSEGCNQVANGLMLRLNGQVKLCPGSSRPDHIYGSIWSEQGLLEPRRIVEIWRNSPNYRHSGVVNNWCPAKIVSLPQRLQNEVLEELEKDEIFQLVASTEQKSCLKRS